MPARGRSPCGNIKKMNAQFITRVRVVTALCVLVTIVIIGRLYLLQIIHGDEYARRADAQSVELKNPLLNRGAIYFSAKDGALLTAATLSDLSTTTGHQRYYPGGSLAAQTLGFVAYNNDHEQKGRYGLERYYEQTLARTSTESYSNFFVELFGGLASGLVGEGGQGDLITTIEPAVQAELERTLATYGTQWNPAFSGGIIMDPMNGEIVAMALSPSFDLNTFNQPHDVRIFGNPLVEGAFEMGSIIKPLTMAAGLDSGSVTEATTYNDTGCIELEQKKICNFDGKARNTVPMQEVLSQSLNLGSAFVASKIGPDIMRNYFLTRYKLGEETGIDLPSEAHGLTGNFKSPRQVEYATMAFGQGISLTPVETVRALASLGNGGLLVTPHLVRAIKYQNGVIATKTWAEGEQILKPETSTAISRMLTKVVDEALAGGSLKMEHYSVAAKTGTAQVADPVNGGYYTDRFLHSFFGYFPSFAPKFVVFLIANEPTGATFASQTWAPPFGSLVKFLINYYNIPPDR